MKKENVTALVLALSVVFSGISIGAYALGNHQGEKKGRDSMAQQVNSLQAKNKENSTRLVGSYSDLIDMNEKYNQLVTEYNSLRDAAVRYVGATQYQPRSPITCSTYNYSSLNSSTTTCY